MRLGVWGFSNYISDLNLTPDADVLRWQEISTSHKQSLLTGYISSRVNVSLLQQFISREASHLGTPKTMHLYNEVMASGQKHMR